MQVSACNFIKKETRKQVFSNEIYEIFKNIFSDRTLLVAASVLGNHSQCFLYMLDLSFLAS